jgi:hypothetical protein
MLVATSDACGVQRMDSLLHQVTDSPTRASCASKGRSPAAAVTTFVTASSPSSKFVLYLERMFPAAETAPSLTARAVPDHI